jgi:DNA polymerase-3 subunit chi
VFSRFQRLVEIVGRDDEDREAARARFRFYRDRGYEIVNHDLSEPNG